MKQIKERTWKDKSWEKRKKGGEGKILAANNHKKNEKARFSRQGDHYLQFPERIRKEENRKRRGKGTDCSKSDALLQKALSLLNKVMGGGGGGQLSKERGESG